MLTEADVQDTQQAPRKRKTKRDRRREAAASAGAAECKAKSCRHALADHQATTRSAMKFCHVCMDICTV